MIKEIQSVIYKGIEDKNVALPGTIWLDEIGGSISGIISFNYSENKAVVCNILNNSTITICTEQELWDLLHKYSITSYDALRIVVRDTNKWGRKPLFVNGTNGVCFSAYIYNEQGNNFLLLYATSGTRGLESIYLHGIWKL